MSYIIIFIKKFINLLLILLKKKFSELTYIIKNLETIIKKKEKEILAKRKKILAELNKNVPYFKKELKTSLLMGFFLYLGYIILILYYNDLCLSGFSDPGAVLPEEIEETKWLKDFKYDFPYKTYVGKAQIVIAWIFNDIIDVYNCPIDGLAPGISPDIYYESNP